MFSEEAFQRTFLNVCFFSPLVLEKGHYFMECLWWLPSPPSLQRCPIIPTKWWKNQNGSCSLYTKIADDDAICNSSKNKETNKKHVLGKIDVLLLLVVVSTTSDKLLVKLLLNKSRGDNFWRAVCLSYSYFPATNSSIRLFWGKLVG